MFISIVLKLISWMLNMVSNMITFFPPFSDFSLCSSLLFFLRKPKTGYAVCALQNRIPGFSHEDIRIEWLLYPKKRVVSLLTRVRASKFEKAPSPAEHSLPSHMSPSAMQW